MKKLFTGLLASTMILSTSAVSFAQETANVADMALEESTQATLSTNYQSGYFEYREIISPQYEKGHQFAQVDKLAAVMKDGKWGYINPSNQVVVPFLYDVANFFSEGKSVVGTGSSATGYTLGIVDTTGRYTPFTCQGSPVIASNPSAYFDNGLAVTATGSFNGVNGSFILKPNGTAIHVPGYTMTTYNEGIIVANAINKTHAVVLNENGDIIHEIGAYKALGITHGVIPIYTETPKLCGYYGYAEKAIRVPLQYYDWATFVTVHMDSAGVAIVSKQGSGVGGIDVWGNVKIPFQYDNLMPLQEGRYLYLNNNKWGYMDENLKTVITPQYDRATTFRNGMAAVKSGSSFYLINSKGSRIEGSEQLDGAIYFDSDTLGYWEPSEYVNITKNGLTGYGQVIYYPDLPVQGDTSDWALDKVIAAIKAELIPADQQNTYFSNVSREDFALLAIISLAERANMSHDDYVKSMTGKNMTDLVNTYPFNDTNNRYVVAAQAMGIMTGRGEKTFDPYADITRQEVAVVLRSMAEVVGDYYSAGTTVTFADRATIANWAWDAVDYVVAENIMNSTGNNEFNPLMNCTREQTFFILYNFYANL